MYHCRLEDNPIEPGSVRRTELSISIAKTREHLQPSHLLDKVCQEQPMDAPFARRKLCKPLYLHGKPALQQTQPGSAAPLFAVHTAADSCNNHAPTVHHSGCQHLPRLSFHCHSEKQGRKRSCQPSSSPSCPTGLLSGLRLLLFPCKPPVGILGHVRKRLQSATIAGAAPELSQCRKTLCSFIYE